MEVRCKGIFMMCLILGLQIHLPVTMFPAGSDTNNTNNESGIEIDTDAVLSKNLLISDPTQRAVNGRTIAQQTHGIRESSFPGPPSEHQITRDDLNKSPAREHHALNGAVNQARPVDLPGLKSRSDINGLESDLGATYIETSKSALSRLPQDLPNIKLEKIQEHLDNLSANLSNRRNIIRAYNVVNKTTTDNIDNQLSTKQTDRHDSHVSLSKANNNIVKSSKYFNSTSIDNQNKTQSKFNRRQFVTDNEGYWSGDLEGKCPSLYTETDDKKWKRKLDTNHVIKVEPGCGSMQNRLVTFNDSSKACARYRLNSDLMQGDIYSYYLGKLIGITYTPPTKMAAVDDQRLWGSVRGQVSESKWSRSRSVILSEWVDNLTPVYMPEELRTRGARLQLGNYGLSDKTREKLCGLVQWSDLMVFDYISANLDRVVNNMFNLKWNARMLDKPIHNLEKSPTGQLVFLDNESGLFHGYRLLETYETYLKDLLQTTCIFRKSTVSAIERLYKSGNTGGLLQEVYEQNEQHHTSLPRMTDSNRKILQERVSNVYKHMQLCKHDANKLMS